MGKRIISLLIALAMVAGAVPAAVIPTFATETVSSNVIHAVSGTVTMDGELSEAEWSPVGKLADGISFGAVYDTNSLYLGIAGEVSDLKVMLNGTDAEVTQKDGSAHELQISLEQVGLDLYKYDQTASLEITSGEHTWTGTVCFDSATLGSRVENFNNNNRTLKGTTSSVYSDGAFTVTLDSTTDASTGNGMNHLWSATQNALNMTSGVSVLEFDMKIDQMPAYPEAAIVYNSYLLVPGMNMVAIGNGASTANIGYIFGITNLEEKGLTLVIQNYNGSSFSDPAKVQLNKKVGEQFHVRMEYEPATHVLRAYCDDMLLWSGYGRGRPNAVSTKTGILSIYNSVVKNYVSKGNVQYTVSELKTGSLKTGNPLDNLTVYDILGENTSAEAIGSNLSLPGFVADPMLGNVNITWKSSDTSLIGDDGVVVPGAQGTVSMTAALAKDPSVTKVFDLTVSSKKPDVSLDAMLNAEQISIDGKTEETVWAKWSHCGAGEGMPAASVAAAWDKGHIYLALNTLNTDTIALTLGAKTVNVDLAAGTSDLEGVAVAVAGGLVELDLPMAALGVQPTDYNNTAAFKAVLTGGNGSTELEENLLTFTGKTVNIQTLANASAGWTIAGSTYSFSSTQKNTAHYIYTSGNGFSTDETTWISQDLKFTSMPATSGAGIATMSAAGYYYYASRNCNGSAGDTFKICLYTDEAGNLRANLLKVNELNATLDLGVGVGDEFRLTTAWNPDGSIDLYVDGSYVGSSNGSCTYYYNGCGDNVLTLRYHSGAVTTPQDVAFQAKNVTVIKTAYETVTDELTASKVFNRVDLERVTGDLPMGSTYSSAYFDDIPVSWSTSDASIIEANGKVHRGETTQTCDITLIAKGKELWTVTATVLPTSEKEQPSPAVYTTAFADDVVIDGSIVGENWHMANRVLADGIQVGEMGAAWNLDCLYIAVRNSGKDFALTVNGKQIVLSEVSSAVSGNYTEIAIPVDYISDETIGYGTELPVTLSIGDGVYGGTLILSGTDWWGTGNAEDPLPMPENNVKSVARGNGKPDGNQGAVEVSNGWHLFDRYSQTGTNPDGIRTYILFMKTSPYENFANRDGTTTVEFDFQAINMPVYTVEEAITTMTPNAYACYGLNWHLSDAADSTKNANLIYGGIFNTKDGLCLVTGGKETYTDLLGKQVGDKFRITLNWNTDDSLEVYVDGVLLRRAENQSTLQKEIGDTSFVVNMLRDLNQPESAADNIDVYLTDIAFGTAYAENPLDTLVWDDIKGENTDRNGVVSDLVLTKELSNPQMGETYPLTWTSSEPNVVDPTTGKVTRPEKGAVSVTLTVSIENGASKSFTFIVLGTSTEPGNTLVVQMDTNPAAGVGSVLETALFTFDTNNNSLVEDMQEVKTINVVRLADLDAYSRINRESLTLWISDDNATYTQVESFKLVQIGKNWYLYDFEATGRYVKVNYTHFDGTDADFLAPLDGIICGSYDDSLVKPENAVTVTAPATTLRDQQAVLEGIANTENLRIWLDGELLYHYTEGGKVYVRIPDPSASGTELTVWNSGTLELSNKEACYEVTYGTRQTHQILDGNRWLLTVPAGTYTYGTVEKEMLLAFGFRTIHASYDSGLTWVDYGTVDETVYNSVNTPKISSDIGWIFDEETGAMFCIAHKTNGFSTLDKSYGRIVVFASYDMGKTWNDAFELQPDTVEGIPFNYIITYSGGIRVPSYDAEGEGIDYVFPVACQYTNSGGLCCRVVYSTDAGKTWQLSQSLLTYGENHGNEAGLSEAWIMANNDGVLVLYSRAQVVGLTNFVMAYSYDNGLTWTAQDTKEAWEANKANEGNVIQGKLSSVYSANTQPLMFRYQQENNIHAPLFVWAGNNALGCTTGIRTPLSVAVSYDGLETWRNIQDLFLETFMDVYTMAGRSMVVNQSVAQVNGNTLLVTYDRNYLKDKVWMTVTDFENFFYRTKGAYDGFESGNPFYEGWSAIDGESANVTTKASQGKQSLHIPENGIIARSIPYLQNGTIKLDVYVTADTDITFALQPAVGTDRNANTLALVSISGMKLNDSISLEEGWNTIQIELELTAGKAFLSANGSRQQALPLVLDAGDYVCYVTAFATTEAYVDEFYVISSLDAEIYTGETQKEPQELPRPSATISAKDTLDMNFYVKKADFPEQPNFIVKLDGVELDESEYAVGEDAVNNRWSVTVGLYANHMCKEVTVQAVDAEGNAISQARTLSIRDIAGLLINVEAADQRQNRLLLAMLDYGTAAQLAMNAEETDLANSNITTEMRNAIMEGFAWPETNAPVDAPVGTSADSKFTASVSALETVTLNYYIKVDDLGENSIKVTLDGEVLEEGVHYTLSEVEKNESMRVCVSIAVNANKMCDVYTVQVVDKDGEAVYAARSMSVRHCIDLSFNTMKAVEQACAAAMLDYGAMAQIAFDATATDLANRYLER